MTKSAGNTHVRRTRSEVTLCGRRIVAATPRPQEVHRSTIVHDPEKVTCKSCRANLGLQAPIHEKGKLR